MQEEGKKNKPCEDLGLMEEKLPRPVAGTYVQLQHRQAWRKGAQSDDAATCWLVTCIREFDLRGNGSCWQLLNPVS